MCDVGCAMCDVQCAMCDVEGRMFKVDLNYKANLLFN